MDVFWTKYGDENYVFFREWTFFEQNMGIGPGILHGFFLCTPSHPTDFSKVASYQVHTFKKNQDLGSATKYTFS